MNETVDPAGTGGSRWLQNCLARSVQARPLPALALVGLASAIVALAIALPLTTSGGATRSRTSSMGGADTATVAMTAGQAMGRAFKGRAPQYEPVRLVAAQADAVTPGATVDRNANTIRFRGTHVLLTIVANPPNGRDMAFRAAGLENATIEVPRDAVVDVHFINGDTDSAHGWLLLDPVVTIGNSPQGPRAFPGSYAPILGDPTGAGQAAETITFRASTTGIYRYECPVPGHAAMGMQGRLVVGA